jgi:hypothetical protein
MIKVFHSNNENIKNSSTVVVKINNNINYIGLINITLECDNEEAKSIIIYNKYIELPHHTLFPPTTKTYYKSLTYIIYNYAVEMYKNNIEEILFNELLTKEELEISKSILFDVMKYMIFILLHFPIHLEIDYTKLSNSLFKTRDLQKSVEIMVDLNNNYRILEDDIYQFAKPFFEQNVKKTSRIINCLKYIFTDTSTVIDIIRNPLIKGNHIISIIPTNGKYTPPSCILMKTQQELNNEEIVFKFKDEHNNGINIKKIKLNIGAI